MVLTLNLKIIECYKVYFAVIRLFFFSSIIDCRLMNIRVSPSF